MFFIRKQKSQQLTLIKYLKSILELILIENRLKIELILIEIGITIFLHFVPKKNFKNFPASFLLRKSETCFQFLIIVDCVTGAESMQLTTAEFEERGEAEPLKLSELIVLPSKPVKYTILISNER